MTAGRSVDRPLRLAFVLDAPRLERWQHELLVRLGERGHAELVAVCLLASAPDADPPAGWARYLDIDARHFAPDPDPAERRALALDWPGVPVLESGDAAERWQDLPDIDLLLGFESASSPMPDALDALSRVANAVLWSVVFGERAVGGTPRWASSLGELHRASATTTMTLEERHGSSAPVCIARAATETSRVSPTITRARLRWLALEVLSREIGKRATGMDAPTIGPRSARRPSIAFDRTSWPSPLGFAAARAGAYVARAVRERLRDERWELAYRFEPLAEDGPLVRERRDEAAPDAPPQALTVEDFVPLRPPTGRYWADPHVLATDDGWQVFVEEYPTRGPARSRRGRIVTFTLDARGRIGKALLALDEPSHLSYPFVFKDGERLFMIPESGARRSVDLYECTGFPNRWEHRRTLLRDVYAVDTTLWRKAGRWWMFTALAENGGRHPHDELHLFSSSTLDTDRWERHPAGALVSDPHRARPAGALFEHGGRLYRPAQDGVAEYGRAMRLMEVTELGPRRYAEREVGVLEPPVGGLMSGVHTFARAPGITMIDTKWRTWRRPAVSGFGT